MTLSAHGVPLGRQPHVWPMRIPEGNATACRTTARPSAFQGPMGRSRLDFSLIDVCHPYRKFLSTTPLSVLGPKKLRGVSRGAHGAGLNGRIEHRLPRRAHEPWRTKPSVGVACLAPHTDRQNHPGRDAVHRPCQLAIGGLIRASCSTGRGHLGSPPGTGTRSASVRSGAESACQAAL